MDDNIKNILTNPSSITLSADASVLLVTDFTRGTLVSIRLHYPAEVKEVANHLHKQMSVVVMYGAALVAESQQIVCIDYNNTLKLTKDELWNLAKENDLLQPGESKSKTKVTDLRLRVSTFLGDANQSTRGQKKSVFHVDNGSIVQPVLMATCGNDLLFVVDKADKQIHQVAVKKESGRLVGTTVSTIHLQTEAHPSAMTYHGGNLYIADRSLGIYSINLETLSEKNHLQAENEFSGTPHGVCISRGDIIFSDAKNHMIRTLKNALTPDTLEHVVLAGTGIMGTSDGYKTVCEFSQPTALCAEGNSLFVVDSVSGAVRLVTNVSPLKTYVEAVRPLYSEFMVHSDIIGSTNGVDIQRAISSLSRSHEYFKSLTVSVSSLLNLRSVSQGPQGVPASKTVVSLEMLIKLLSEFRDIIKTHNPAYLDNFHTGSVPTLVNENLHNLLRLETETPTVLDVAHDFCRATHELMKKQCQHKFHYFTSKKKAYYEHKKTGI
ncbi:MAG: hypothetical protein ABW168_22390 [Sedimenticola sp.]